MRSRAIRHDGNEAASSWDGVRRLPVGLEAIGNDRAHMRVWAPKCSRVALVLESDRRTVPLEAEGNGFFSALIENIPPGSLYRLELDGDRTLHPDPASRFQPDGPHGPSQLIDPGAFAWTDQDWKGRPIEGQVVYEMHIGTFTAEGSWKAAMRELPHLAELGVTVIELMPLADFPGRFGWGYDGVDLFAPTRLYGQPDDARRFVDRAHSLGLAVIHDVVYNHLGPDGNHLSHFSDAYVTDRYKNEWGQAINFDGPESGPVREFFTANAAYWIAEFHIDGLRLDATQQIFDATRPHILAEISRAVRQAANGRATILIAENEPQHATMVRPVEDGGCGLDAIWNDDYHHTATVALTGRNEAYYMDYRGTPQELVSAMKYGFLYQGQWYAWQRQKRGMPALDVRPPAMIAFLQNHDQIANSGRGLRIDRLTTPGRLRALTALTLLGPGTPMLFQGQEFAASTPFLYFADHADWLAPKVAEGRAEFLSQFPTIATRAMQAQLAPPDAEETFTRCKLDHTERLRPPHREIYALHRDLLRLRREDPVFRRQGGNGLDGAVLGEEAFCLRVFDDDGGDRLILVNLGRDLTMTVLPEPLLAPPPGRRWASLWSSEDPAYGGHGTPEPVADGRWHLPGHSLLALEAVPSSQTETKHE